MQIKPSLEVVSDDSLSEARSAWMTNKEAGLRFHGPDEDIIEIFRKKQREQRLEWEKRVAEGDV